MIAVRDCPGVEPQLDGTCAACGNRTAQYTRYGQRVWEHKRGAQAGSASAKIAGPKAAASRARNTAARLARVSQLEAALEQEKDWQQRDMMVVLRSIDAKLDELLSRPAGMVEWKPDHRRHVDGGTSVRKQRRKVGVRARTRTPKVRLTA